MFIARYKSKVGVKFWLKNNKTVPRVLVADSCACGLGVLAELLKHPGLPSAIFLADGEKNPFGLKTQIEIRNIVKDWLKYFTGKLYNVGFLLIACNTASAAIRGNYQKKLEQKFKIPIIGMVDPAVMALKNQSRIKKIAILGTKSTIKSGIYQKLLSERLKDAEVKGVVCTEMERIVARGKIGTREEVEAVKQELSSVINWLDCAFLGCTCFSFLKQTIKEVLANGAQSPILIDPAKAVALEAVKVILRHSRLKKKKFSGENKPCIFTTGNYQWIKYIESISTLVFPYKLEINFVKIR